MSDLSVRPMGSKVIVRAHQQTEQVSKSGIVIPVTAQSRTLLSGVVIDIGNLVTNLAAGDIVYFPHGGGFPVQLDNKDYLFFNGPTTSEGGDFIAKNK